MLLVLKSKEWQYDTAKAIKNFLDVYENCTHHGASGNYNRELCLKPNGPCKDAKNIAKLLDRVDNLYGKCVGMPRKYCATDLQEVKKVISWP